MLGLIFRNVTLTICGFLGIHIILLVAVLFILSALLLGFNDSGIPKALENSIFYKIISFLICFGGILIIL